MSASVKESCPCGATFEYQSSYNTDVAAAVNEWRDAHKVCRVNASVTETLKAERAV